MSITYGSREEHQVSGTEMTNPLADTGEQPHRGPSPSDGSTGLRPLASHPSYILHSISPHEVQRLKGFMYTLLMKQGLVLSAQQLLNLLGGIKGVVPGPPGFVGLKWSQGICVLTRTLGN